jgi:phosphoribosylamine--glycine ligase
MGSYAPVSDLEPGLLSLVHETILQPAVAGLRAEGRPYRGALYAGLMLTRDGPKALEFNCRFGDPETQVLLPLLDVDLADVLRSCALGQLDPDALSVRQGAVVCVVLAAEGYPEHPRHGDVIHGIEDVSSTEALVFQAGTALVDGELVTNGGRILSVVGTGFDVADAAERAYAAADAIHFAGKQMRRDIARAPVAQLV